jgi:hypothetical protein
MKRDVYYIVYNKLTFEIVHTSYWYDKKTHELQAKEGFHYLNVTLPRTKDILAKVNEINKTNYN